MKRALISVSDKNGLIPFAETLINTGYSIISTGGTAKYLEDNSIPNTHIEDISGFPEILDGRVKTLHPKIMGGILADSNNPEHLRQLEEMLITRIDLVVVYLYPFEKLYNRYVEERKTKTDIEHHNDNYHQNMIENIDIGGVTLLRAAAKNYHSVCIISSIEDYSKVKELLQQNKPIPLSLRQEFAIKAFSVTANYDNLICNYLIKHKEQELLTDSTSHYDVTFPGWDKIALRYGENPHQEGYFLTPPTQSIISILHGKELSYNNYLDVDAALKLIMKFNETAVAIIKHTNPCGVGCADTLVEAYLKAFQTDTQSPFGGIVVTNRSIDLFTAKSVNEIFTEIIIAPDYSEEALEFLMKKKMRRLIQYSPELLNELRNVSTYVSCLQGLLSQTVDIGFDNENEWKAVSQRVPHTSQSADLLFAWKVVSSLKSNAICLAHNRSTLGLGMGQTSRIDSLEQAYNRGKKYGHNFSGSVCASDGFFPFRDSIDLLAEMGVTAIIQPGGSKGDEEVIKACNEHKIAMIFTGMRHFAH